MTDTFTWTSPSGVEIKLPPLKRVKAGIIRRHRKSDPIDFIFSVVEETTDAEMLARIDDLPSDEVNDLFAAWQADGPTVGESQRSSTS